MLFQMLEKNFGSTLKTSEEKEFIYQRILSFDQYYCLQVYGQLWQSYLEIGREKHMWPVSRSSVEMYFSHVWTFYLC